MSRPAVHVIGEALIDVVVRADGVERVRPGGSPANVAVGLARLGVPADLLCRIGADAYGDLLRAHLEQAGDGLPDGGSPAPARTSTAVATLGADGSASYRFDIDWDPGTIAVPTARILHTGSLATVLEPGATAVANALSAADPATLVSVDPNVRPTVGVPQVEVRSRTERLAGRAHLLKMSDEDLDWLYPGAAPEEVAARMHELGVRLFVVTLGAQGCFLSTSEWSCRIPAEAATLVDTIGAGDAFMSGLLYAVIADDGDQTVRTGVLQREQVENWAHTAQRSAALTLGRDGAEPPLLAELHARELVSQSAGEAVNSRRPSSRPVRPEGSSLTGAEL